MRSSATDDADEKKIQPTRYPTLIYPEVGRALLYPAVHGVPEISRRIVAARATHVRTHVCTYIHIYHLSMCRATNVAAWRFFRASRAGERVRDVHERRTPTLVDSTHVAHPVKQQLLPYSGINDVNISSCHFTSLPIPYCFLRRTSWRGGFEFFARRYFCPVLYIPIYTVHVYNYTYIYMYFCYNILVCVCVLYSFYTCIHTYAILYDWFSYSCYDIKHLLYRIYLLP